jgi:leucyl/phenylalanyl-tRNA--protein transferase
MDSLPLEESSIPIFFSRLICKEFFPWPISDDTPVTWFAPENRGVVCIADAHYPKSFLKWLKKNPFYLKLNTQFPKIIQECALGKMRKSSETWLTDELIYVYHDLFLKKHAYSIECYNQEDQLVGGLYGVALGNYFSGESMFFLESNASKYCLWALLEFLKSKKVKYLDTQMITPTVELFGGGVFSASSI